MVMPAVAATRWSAGAVGGAGLGRMRYQRGMGWLLFSVCGKDVRMGMAFFLGAAEKFDACD
jgi:hypothetical protein